MAAVRGQRLLPVGLEREDRRSATCEVEGLSQESRGPFRAYRAYRAARSEVHSALLAGFTHDFPRIPRFPRSPWYREPTLR